MSRLNVGEKLGAYEILAPIGAGGMGEVYRARDTKLKREVALKVLPEAFSRDHNRMARFQREAEVLASLNHPNIAQIYGVVESGGARALAMELVPGAPLKGPFPFEKAASYARQIAAALEAAHQKNIIHRDLKPGNILITPEGEVKVLDFGLAAVTPAPAAQGDPTESPTLTMGATQAGAILGTAAYMSPEQAQGKPVDKRADIWSFGVVLYEMLTGRRLFKGSTVTEVLASVLRDEPEWERVPPQARMLLRRCLEKDPKRRLHDIADAMPLIDDAPAAEAPVRTPRLPWAVAGGLAVALSLALWAYWNARQTAPKPAFAQLDLEIGDGVVQPALSPDGSFIVFFSRGQLAMRTLDQTQITPIAGTEGASFPFFSPDGQWIGFFAGGKLKKMALEGGAPQALCDVATARGGAWTEDGYILTQVTTLGGLFRVSASGGTPQQFTDTKGDPENMTAHRWPQVLPGGKGVLFSATQGVRGSLRILKPGGQMITVVRNSSYGRYLPSGYLVYVQSGTLFAAPIDLNRAALTGPAVTLAQGVRYTPNVAYADFDASPSGTLVYIRGPGAGGRVVSWMDSAGKVSPFLEKPAEYLYPRISPDGKRLAVIGTQDNVNNLWVYDSARDTMTKLTADQSNLYPVWTPDGDFIVYGSRTALGWTRSDGGLRREAGVKAGSGLLNPWSISADGRTLAFATTEELQSWTATVEKGPDGLKFGQAQPLLQSATNPALSPDGSFVAYSSTQSGRSEIYAAPLAPGAKVAQAGRVQVSNQGGAYPIWSAASHELFYRGPDQRIWIAEYAINGAKFTVEKPRVWSPKQLADVGNTPSFDVERGGKRVAALLYPGGEDPKPETHLRVLLNLNEELHRRSGAGGKP